MKLSNNKLVNNKIVHIKIIYNPDLVFIYAIYTMSANLANWDKLFSEWILTFCGFVIDYEHK